MLKINRMTLAATFLALLAFARFAPAQNANSGGALLESLTATSWVNAGSTNADGVRARITGAWGMLAFSSNADGVSLLPDSAVFNYRAPTFTNIIATPSIAGLGSTVRIEFTASESLLFDPTVWVNGHGARLGSQNALTYYYFYTVIDDLDGPALIEIIGLSFDWNSGFVMTTDALTIDKTQPETFFWKDYNGPTTAGGYMPDFDAADEFGLNILDAPTAEANSLWWLARKYPNAGVVAPTATPQTLVAELGALMMTDEAWGTEVRDFQAGTSAYLAVHGLDNFLEAHWIPADAAAAGDISQSLVPPNFDEIALEIERSHDVTLLLGLWTPLSIFDLGGGYWDVAWMRLGGHYVTCAGVQTSPTPLLAISDPFLDAAEAAIPSSGIVRGDNHLHPEGHFDGVSASHDVYEAVSRNDGTLWLLGYPNDSISYFGDGQNRNGPELVNTRVYSLVDPYNMYDTFIQIEAAMAISPIEASTVGTILIDVEPAEAPWTLYTPDGVTSGTGPASLTDVTPGEYTIYWSSLPGWQDPTPMSEVKTLAAGGVATFAATYTPLSDGVYVKALPASAAKAPWTIIDSMSQPYSGVGDAYLPIIYNGPVTITWGALQNHELPVPSQETKTLSLGSPVVFTGVYARHTGRVWIVATPNEAAWTLTDGDGGLTSGTGSQALLAVPTGQLTLVWHALTDYHLPISTTVTAQLTNGGIVRFEEHYSIIEPDPPTDPDPADGETGVVPATVLKWTAGERAHWHEVYLWPEGSAKPASPTVVVYRAEYDTRIDLDAGTIYSWQVVSKNASGEAAGPQWWFTTLPDAPLPAPPPTGIMASDGAYSDKIRVTWYYPTPEAWCRLYRSDTLEGEKVKLGSWQTETIFDDLTPTSSTLYYYWVRAAANAHGDRASDFLTFDTGWMHAEADLDIFKITYKNVDIELDETGALRGRTHQNRAAGSTGKATIKIKKLKEIPPGAQDEEGVKYARAASVPQITILGDISKLFTEAPVRKIHINGEMKNATLKETYCEWLVAHEIGKVKMSGSLKGFSGGNSNTPRGQSRANTETPVASTIIQSLNFASFSRARIILKGVVLRELTVPGQKVDLVNVFTQKVRDEDGNLKLNLGGIEGGRIEAQNIRTIKTNGGPILPTEIFGSTRGNPMSIKGQIGIFTSDRAGKNIMDIRPGDVAPQLINVQTPKLTILAVGGDMTPGKIYASDRIPQMSSKFKKVRFDGALQYRGGQFGRANRDASGNFQGVTTPTLVVSGLGNAFFGANIDIGKVFGAKGVVGIFMSGGLFDPSAEFGVKPNFTGSILKIQTKASKKGAYPTPTIFGQAWSMNPIQYTPEGKPPNFIEFNN